ncbi:AMP-binding protein [Lentzea sp. NPDC060358]|uniref:AMP-binding protein n=1 Tax=Lentzea sp. NPDC060358 TaxID=3347103 RepID=UPI00365EBF11
MSTVPNPGAGHTLVDVLRERAAATPGREALVFADGEPAAVTDAELDREARAVASALREHAVDGDRVLILLPPGRAYVTAFLGCLYAGLVAVPQYPPTARRGGGAVLAVATDARVAVAVGDAAVIRAVTEGHPALAAAVPVWLDAAAVPPAPADESWRGPRPDALALLQYTSGSTGTPKGVMVRHDNLVHNSAVIASAIGAHPGSRSVSWLPPYHDMGLIGGILQPLHSGFTGVLMAPMSFLRDPVRWLDAISRYRASFSVAPDFGYLECARRISAEAAAALDLSCWEHAMIGAEPIRPSTLDEFAERFAPSGFRRSAFHPCYGLAEATLFVTGGRRAGARVLTLDRAALEAGTARAATGSTPSTRVTGCGSPLGQDRVVVADPESGRPCEDGRVGEILVGGPTVAAGYWGRDESFPAPVAGLPGEYLRTGDLGFRSGGDLFVTGRAKDLVIVGGRNLSPHDLEVTGESAHPALAPGRSAAFSVDVAGAERVVLVHEVVRGFAAEDAPAVTAAVAAAVTSEHGTAPHEVLLVRPGKVPRTSSGKVRRSRCRELWAAGGFDALAPAVLPPCPPSGDLVPAVAEVLSRVLRVDPGALRADVPLTGLGLDSVRAVQVAAGLRDAFGTAPELTELLGDLTPRDLGTWSRTAPAPAPARDDADGLATGRQEWLWLLDRMGAGPAYTVVGGVRLRGELDVERLRAAVTAVLGALPVLHTTFTPDRESLRATARPGQPVPLPVVHGDPGTALAELAARGFDLATGPLLHAVLVRSEDEWTLGVAVHHIAVDGWSLAVLLGQVGRAYATGEPVPPDTSLPGGPRPAEGDEDFWRKALHGACAVALPLDRAPGPQRSWRGSSGPLTVAAAQATAVRALAERHQATPFMVLLSALALVLAHRTGQTDVVVGTPAARRDAATADAVGLFVTTLPIRIDVSGDPDFAELLGRVRAACLAAYAHQHLPFERIVETAELLDPPGPRAPLVRVCLAVQNLPFADWPADGLAAEPFELPSPGAQFELSITLTEHADGSLRGHTVHAADLLGDATVAGVRDDLAAVLAAVGRGDDRPLPPPSGLVPPERVAALLREHPAVAGARVAGNGTRAELTPEGDPVPDGVLRSFLSAELPGTAIPLTYHWAAVPAPFELVSLEAPEPPAFVAPRDEVETTLAAIWGEVIGLPEVSVTAAFLDLGGHSLQAARIVARAEAAFGVRVGVEDVLRAGTTVEELAALVRAELARPRDPEVDAAVAALDRLSDEEIAALLGGEGT